MRTVTYLIDNHLHSDSDEFITRPLGTYVSLQCQRSMVGPVKDTHFGTCLNPQMGGGTWFAGLIAL